MIGDIIKKKRISQGLTKSELAEGICSQKYIYLIEKNKRNPSVRIINQLNEKLGTDLFQYYPYLGFNDAIAIVKHKDNMERYIQSGDIMNLRKEAICASKLDDFKAEPLNRDILVAELAYEGLIEGKTSKVVTETINLLKNEELNIDSITLVNIYVLLSSCYQIEGQFVKAEEAIESAYSIIEKKFTCTKYRTVIISVMISLTSFLYHTKKYDGLIKHANTLLAFQEQHHEYDRIYYAYFYLSFGYYHINNFNKSEEYFLKGLHSSFLFKNKMDMSYISKMDDFDDIAYKINESYIKKFYSLME